VGRLCPKIFFELVVVKEDIAFDGNVILDFCVGGFHMATRLKSF